jgi:hypothetical protein
LLYILAVFGYMLSVAIMALVPRTCRRVVMSGQL